MKGKMFLVMLALLVISYFLYEFRGGPKRAKVKEPAQMVTGVISDGNGNPIPKATIYVLGAETKAYTDKNGEYIIEATKGDELIISHSQYKRRSIEVNEKKENINLELKNSELKDKIKEDFPEMEIK